MQFEDLGLAEPIVRAVTKEGYTRPTPIQSKAIPHVLAGRDLLGCAQTGTGKTAAFALPILHRLAATHQPSEPLDARRRKSPGTGRKPRVLILCPTRELGAQIGESFRAYGRNLPLKHTVIFGGVNQNPQVRALRDGLDIIVATPGRLLDLMNQRHVDLSAIEVFVLDEADRMLDMGFLPDLRKISAKVPKKRQTLLFSATMPADIRALASSILNNPVSVQVDPESSAVQMIEQSVYHVPRKSKTALLTSMLKGEAAGRTLVFTRTKHGADKVVKGLTKEGIRAAAIHGNKTQNTRTRTLAAFKSKSPPVLIATDIASRGIDVDEIMHVINFDLPNEAETYVHRIGRTARAGASGTAVSFCAPDERNHLRAIERLTGGKIAVRTDLADHAITPPPAQENDESRSDTARKPRFSKSSAKGTGRQSKGRSKSPSSPRGNGRSSGGGSSASNGRKTTSRNTRRSKSHMSGRAAARSGNRGSGGRR